MAEGSVEPMVTSHSEFERYQQLVQDIRKTNPAYQDQPNSVEQWFAALTPEMKTAIRQKGLPLFALILMAQQAQQQQKGGGRI